MKKFIILIMMFLVSPSVYAFDYNVYKLENGQTLVVKQVKNNPIVTIDTWIKTGSIDETDKNNGVAHFLEHLFFKGSSKYPTGEFDRILESKGAITNAGTSKDFTHYYISIPSKHFDLAMEMHADMLLNPQIPRTELEKERKVVIEEIAKDKNSPDEIVYDNFNEMIYKTHPYKRKVIGQKSVIETISREEIFDFYKKHYVPSNMITIVIGDVEPQKVIDLVKSNFKTSSQQKVVKSIYQPEKPITQALKKVDYFPTKTGYMITGFKGVKVTNDDNFALDILASVLGDGQSSRFYKNIEEEKQLAFKISVSNICYRDDGVFIIKSNFVPDNLDKLQTAIFEQIKEIQQKGITQEELNRAKSKIEQDTYYARESISNIAAEIGYSTILTGKTKAHNEYLEKIKKVSLQDVKRAANNYLQESKSATSIVLPLKYKNPPQKVSQKETYEAKLVKQNSQTQKYLLENKATLLVTQNNVNDIVAISINAKGGEFEEQIKGVGFLTGAVMLKGTQNYSEQELSKLMQGNGVVIDYTCNGDYFRLNILTTKPKLALTLKILDEVVNNATFDDYKIEKVKLKTINNIRKNRDIPLQSALENYRTMIFEDSPYSVTTQVIEKNLPKIERDNILTYYKKIFYPQNVVISVNGDVDKTVLVNEFSKIFRAKNGTIFDYKSHYAEIPSLVISKGKTLKVADLQASWLILGWQTCGVLNKKDYATLQIINTILGSGMSSRLFQNLRDKDGLAYNIGSGFSPNVLRGSFTVYIGTNPKNLATAQARLFGEVNRFKTEFVSNKELEEAKEKLLGNYILGLETNMDKASTIGWFETSGRGFEFIDEYNDLINSVTSSDIIEVANKYFNEKYVISIVDKK